MIRSELIQKIADENPHLAHSDAERIVATFFEEIAAALTRGDRVELRGFGTFFTKMRKGRTNRNPLTGGPMVIPEKRVPMFKTSRLLRDRVGKGA